VDLNSATVEQMLRAPRIGPKTASAIVNFRQKEWAVSEDLLATNGISKSKLEDLPPL
jgi:DNA uptake protein ComE-like DNA-binding protein